MRFLSRTVLGLTLLLSCLAVASSHAQPQGAPVYARQRADARRGGVWEGGSRYAGQYSGRYNGNYFSPPAITGSWYVRPYPYHFDYYRQRFSAPPQTPECPCAEPPSQY